jgi:modulator of FtsH protease HflK
MAERHFPPGGRPPSSELADILAQLQQRWRRLRPGPIIGLVGLVIALICLWSSWFTVQPEETGVVQRFGKLVRTAEPGLHFKWPYGIESVRLVPTARVLKEEFGFRTLTSAPGQRTQ